LSVTSNAHQVGAVLALAAALVPAMAAVPRAPAQKKRPEGRHKVGSTSAIRGGTVISAHDLVPKSLQLFGIMR
jgi:uncharacterized membrane protein